MTIETSIESTSEIVNRWDVARRWIAVGAVFGLLSVVVGAAGTHVLESRIDADSLDTLETAVRFQMYHALAILMVGALAGTWGHRMLNLTGWMFTAGTLIFSGSLYLIAFTDIGAFGAVAPIGGLALILAWASLILAALRR
jgi:uncharacterized membrane protein YgdD (TMEM256/DUF423 family)